MESLSSIDTLFYPGLVEGFAPKTTLPVPAIDVEQQETQTYYAGTYNAPTEEVDLSNYYNEVHPEDLLVKTGQNVIESAQALDNTMVVAMQNGYKAGGFFYFPFTTSWSEDMSASKFNGVVEESDENIEV